MREYTPQRVPAVSLVILSQKGTLNQAWGIIDPNNPASPPTSPQAIFDLASLTKLFTVTAFLQAVTQEKVALDDPLVSVIPEFGGAPRPIDGGQDPHTKVALPTPPENIGKTVAPELVTFRHLLTHTSGLPAWRDVFNAAGEVPPAPPESINPTERWQRGLAAICSYPFVSLPDGVVRYSDIGLMLLGEATARLTRMRLDEAIYAAISPKNNSCTFDPLRHNPSSQGLVIPTEMDATWRKRRIFGEVHDENACGVGGIAGHAGLFADAAQVAAFGREWLTPSPFGIDPDLAKEAIRQQAETNGERRGLGWMLKSFTGSSAGDNLSPQTVGHTGFTGTSLFIDPVNQLVVALLTNAVYYGRDVMPSYELRRAVHTLIGEALLA